VAAAALGIAYLSHRYFEIRFDVSYLVKHAPLSLAVGAASAAVSLCRFDALRLATNLLNTLR